MREFGLRDDRQRFVRAFLRKAVGEIEERQAVIGVRHLEIPIAIDDGGGVDAEEARCEIRALGDQLLRAFHDCRADRVRGPRPDSRPSTDGQIRIPLFDDDALCGDVEPFGRKVAEDGGVSLTGGVDAEPRDNAPVRDRQNHAFIAAAGMLEKAGNSEAAKLAPLRGIGTASGKAGPVRDIDRCRERAGEIAAVIVIADRGAIRHRLRPDQIAAAKRDRVDFELARRRVDEPLHHVVGLRPPGAAVRTRRQRVGEGETHADEDVPDVVHSRKTVGEILRRDPGARRRDVSAEIDSRRDPQRQEPSLAVEGERCVAHLVASLVVAQEGFRSGRHPVHGTSELLRGDEQRRIFRISRRLQPECAADIAGKDAKLAGRHAEDSAHLRLQGVRALRRRVEREAAAFEHRRRAARLERGARDPLVERADANRVGSFRDDLIHFAPVLADRRRAGPVDREISRRFRPELRGACRQSHACLDDGRQRLVVDRHEIGCVTCRRERLGDDEGDRFADVHDPVASERRPVRYDQRSAVAAGERARPRDVADAGLRDVFGGQDGDAAVACKRRLNGDTADAGVGVFGADEDADETAIELEIVGESPLAAQ